MSRLRARISGPRRWRPLAAALLALCAGLCPPARAAEGPEAGEYEVKAAFLYNFAKFIEWPRGTFPDPEASISLCVLGEDPFGAGLEEVVRGESVGGRPIAVVHPERGDDLRRCQVLFIARSERAHLAEILSSLRGKPVFTVGESDGFLAAGGLLRFVLVDGKVRFEINRPAIEASPLTVSSKLLRLAVNSDVEAP